jgi:hypothetical protein
VPDQSLSDVSPGDNYGRYSHGGRSNHRSRYAARPPWTLKQLFQLVIYKSSPSPRCLLEDMEDCRFSGHWSLQRQLYLPLGPWLHSANHLRRNWPYYYDHIGGDLYVRQDDAFTRCVPIDSIRFTPVSTSAWKPTQHSTPVHARPTINGRSWIPSIPPPLPGKSQ